MMQRICQPDQSVRDIYPLYVSTYRGRQGHLLSINSAVVNHSPAYYAATGGPMPQAYPRTWQL
eukprot:scaffold872_cov421-Prasinococcus_capsulatus_cf.AAC.22